MSSSEHCRRAIFQIYNVHNLKITRIITVRICNIVYQEGSRWDPKCVFNFLRFFERTLYKANYIIFILSWCGTHTKIRSKLVDIVTAGSQKITLWGPQRTTLGILRVNIAGRTFMETMNFLNLWLWDVIDDKKERIWYPYFSTDCEWVFHRTPDFLFPALTTTCPTSQPILIMSKSFSKYSQLPSLSEGFA